MICIWNFTVGKKKKKKPIKCTPEVAEAKIYIFFFPWHYILALKEKNEINTKHDGSPVGDLC